MGHPPSPASSIDGLVQLERYMNTTAASSLQQTPRAPGEVVQTYAPTHHQRYRTAYLSDGFSPYHLSDGYSHQQEQDRYIPSTVYPGVNEPAGRFYGMITEQACHSGYIHPPYTPETSPPARPIAEDVSITRRGRSIVRRPSRAEPRRTKRSRAEKKAEQPIDAANLDFVEKPLSEMAKEMPDVVVHDVGTYAHRPVIVRQQEAAEQSKVKRPLNDFVLYRKAYIDVVKARFMPGEKTINQQRVSRICGDSWKMEVPDIKSKFKELSNVERDKHGQAFPEYKYAPKQAKKLKGDDTSTSVQSKARTRASTRSASRRPATAPSSSRVHGQGQFSYGDFPETVKVEALSQQQGSYESDAYWCSPGMQPLLPVRGAEHPQAQTQIHYHGHPSRYLMPEFGYEAGPRIKEETPAPDNYLAHAVPRMDQNLEGFSGPCLDLCIDPSLLPRGEEFMYQCMPIDGASKSHRGLGDGGDIMAAMPDLDVDGAHNVYLRGGQDDWHIEHFDETSHFNDWMAQEEHTHI